MVASILHACKVVKVRVFAKNNREEHTRLGIFHFITWRLLTLRNKTQSRRFFFSFAK